MERAAEKSSSQLPIMLLLFAGSGCSALIYEIVWYHMLALAIGATAVSLGVLLATFMGGLCLGSLLLPRLKRAQGVHPLKVYGYIEAGIALFGLLQLVLIPLIDRVYLGAGAHSGPLSVFVRAIFCAIAILPSTILMGASLPAIARWAKSTPKGVSWWGLLYGMNTAGAVFGALLAGFYLLRVFDTHIATFVAAAVNLAVAGLSFALASRISAEVEPEADDKSTQVEASATPATDDKLIHMGVLGAVALSGAVSMGAQVVWTRLLGLMMGATVYVFSILLGVFLIGLGLGAAAGAKIGRKIDARTALGASQLLACIGMAWTAMQLSVSVPFWPVNPSLENNPVNLFQLDFLRVFWAIIPATLCWGAAVPLAFAAAVRPGVDPGRTVGGVYAANTLGAIAGALVTSLILVPVVGTEKTLKIMVLLSGLAALAAFAPQLRLTAVRNTALVGAGLALIVSPALATTLKGASPELTAWGRRLPLNTGYADIIEVGEGINSSIAISRWKENGAIQFHVAGKVEASNLPEDLRLERMLGYIPWLFKPDAESVLIVGFGAGVTAGTFTTFEKMKNITICEMEPLVPPTSTKYFGRENHYVKNDPRTTIHYDDGRHYMLTTKNKYDIITSDPIHPFVKGAASLYSKEYYENVKKRLNPGGVVTQWIPLYESDFAVVKSEIATFFEVFPYATIFSNNTADGFGYDTVMVGSMEPLVFNPADLNARLANPQNAVMAQSLAEVGFYNAQSLFSTYTADKAALSDWIKGSIINRDRDLKLQYLAGWALNKNDGDAISKEMHALRGEPMGIKIVQPPAPEPLTLPGLQ